MTKQEIKDAIVKGIAGQGTNVDGGGYLPKILDAIVDLIPEGGAVAPKPTITVNAMNFPETQKDLSAEQMAALLGITMDELLTIQNQFVIHVQMEPGFEVELTRVALFYTNKGFRVVFGGKDLTGESGMTLLLYKAGSLYSLYGDEI